MPVASHASLATEAAQFARGAQVEVDRIHVIALPGILGTQ